MMTNTEQVESLRVVHEALAAGRLDVAEMVYRSIPGCETHPMPTVEQLESAIHLRAQVVTTSNRMAESDARSDPGDNFASQHAMGLCSQRDRANVEILERGGTAEFRGLFVKATGARVPAKLIDTQYGRSWMVCDAETGRSTGVFYGDSKGTPRSAIGKAGLEVRNELAPAKAVLAGRGYGNSGTAWVETIRLDGGWPGAPEWRQKEGR